MLPKICDEQVELSLIRIRSSLEPKARGERRPARLCSPALPHSDDLPGHGGIVTAFQQLRCTTHRPAQTFPNKPHYRFIQNERVGQLSARPEVFFRHCNTCTCRLFALNVSKLLCKQTISCIQIIDDANFSTVYLKELDDLCQPRQVVRWAVLGF
jgi:hypothetical protein